jgi:hypothetical protein
VQILPAISAGLPRQQMFDRMIHDIETACDRLGGGGLEGHTGVMAPPRPELR